MPRITNEAYKKLFQEGEIDLFPPEKFHELLDKITLRNHPDLAKQYRYFLIILYWSGRRPVEILELKGKDVGRSAQYVTVFFHTVKKGEPSRLFFNTHFIPEIREFREWTTHGFPEMFLFQGLRSGNTAKVRWKGRGNQPMEKIYFRPTHNLWYYIRKWFGVPPYFFRHNRLSSMANKGASLLQLKHQKGAKSVKSVEVYVRIAGGVAAKEAAKFNR